MKLNREMKVALFFICFAIFYLVMTTQIQTKDLYSTVGLNSKSMPKLYGVLMIVLGVILFVTSYLKQRKQTAPEEKKPVTMIKLFGRDVPRGKVDLVASILLFAFYAGTYSLLGFVLSGFIYLTLMILLLTPQRLKSRKTTIFTALFSFVFVYALYLIFTRVLSMMLPRGMLG